MAATTAGTKTVTVSVAPHLTASALTTILAIPVENMTVAQFKQIEDALNRVTKGLTPTATIGSLLV